jgi:hypothetical protein
MNWKTLVVVVVALVAGAVIGFVDSRPTWDDTGVAAGALFLSALVLACIRPRAAWLIGLAVGLPVVLFNVIAHGNFGSFLAIAFSLAGAAIGYGIGRALGVDGARRTA